jgi:hypothetical protein
LTVTVTVGMASSQSGLRPVTLFGFGLSRRRRVAPETALLFLFYNYSLRPASNAVKAMGA